MNTLQREFQQEQIEELKLKADYCGLVYNIDEDGELQVLGSIEQIEEYEGLKDIEVFEDEDGRYIVVEEESDHSDVYTFNMRRVYLD
jgi:hypothetical protein